MPKPKVYKLSITDDYNGGVWTKGHWTDAQFTDALKAAWGYAPYGPIVREYWRVSFGCGWEYRCYDVAKKGQRGAFPVTQCHTVRWIQPKPKDDWAERMLVTEILGLI